LKNNQKIIKFQPGDRVTFLNEKGGGYVSRVISENIVSVSIKDGFEIPYQVTELLKVGEAAASAIKQFEEKPEENPDLFPLYPETSKGIKLKEGAYLAIIPEDQEKILESNLELYLVNKTDYEVLFGVYLNKSGNFHGLEYGYVQAQSMWYLATIKRSQIEEWVNGLVQMVFFNTGKTIPINPASATISFKPLKIYKEPSFSFEDILQQKAIMVTLETIDKLAIGTKIDRLEPENILVLNEKMNSKEASIQKSKPIVSFLDKHKVDDTIAEVDLHINEIVENADLFDKIQLLTMQLNYFRKCMEQAQVERLSKIIFIHGVGNGTLKNEILRYLEEIEGIQIYDAPYARYGLGATEVLFYRNK
jgi:hypothetical protein